MWPISHLESLTARGFRGTAVPLPLTLEQEEYQQTAKDTIIHDNISSCDRFVPRIRAEIIAVRGISSVLYTLLITVSRYFMIKLAHNPTVTPQITIAQKY